MGRAVDAEVAPAEVVGEDHQDVGAGQPATARDGAERLLGPGGVGAGDGGGGAERADGGAGEGAAGQGARSGDWSDMSLALC